jgi:hypothetical protein
MLHRPPGHVTWHAPLPLHSTEQPMPLHVTAQTSSPSQTHESPGAHVFFVVGPGVAPASLVPDGVEEEEEHAARTRNAVTTGKDFMPAS